MYQCYGRRVVLPTDPGGIVMDTSTSHDLQYTLSCGKYIDMYIYMYVRVYVCV